MKRFLEILIGVAIIGGICYGLNTLREEKEAEPEPEIIRPVRTIALAGGVDTTLRHYFGTVQGGKRADLSFRVSGTLNKILVEKGVSVKKGALLATLDPRDFNTAVSQAKSALAQAQAQYVDAQANFKRYENLYKQKVVPRATYDTYKTQLDVTKSAVGTAQAQVKSVQDSLKDTELRAPFSGVIADRMVENFQDVNAKQTIFSLQDISNLEIVFNIPDNDVLSVPLPNNMTFNQLIKNSENYFILNAKFDAIPGKLFPLKIKEVAAQADSATKTYPVTATMPPQNGVRILPGMSVTVEADFSGALKTQKKFNSEFYVPLTAVLHENNNNYLWRYENGTANKINITTGTPDNNGNIEVKSENLKHGDVIITAGVYFLHEGQHVRLVEE